MLTSKSVDISIAWRDGMRIQCANCRAMRACDTKLLPGPHTGTVLTVIPDSKYLVVQYDDRVYTETVHRSAVYPI